MDHLWLLALGSVILVSLLSLVGVFLLALDKKTRVALLMFLVSFSAGALFGNAFIHLLPETAASIGFTLPVSLSVLLGIVIFFIIEKFIFWHHCHISSGKEHIHTFAYMNLLGDGIHNFIDGMIIAGSYLVSVPLGVATTLAVALHEIPQELGDFGVLIYGGFKRIQALAMNLVSASMAIIGALVVLFVGPDANLTTFLVPFAAGGFIYIAGSDLIPELKKEENTARSIMQLIGFVFGVGVMVALKMFA